MHASPLRRSKDNMKEGTVKVITYQEYDCLISKPSNRSNSISKPVTSVKSPKKNFRNEKASIKSEVAFNRQRDPFYYKE